MILNDMSELRKVTHRLNRNNITYPSCGNGYNILQLSGVVESES